MVDFGYRLIESERSCYLGSRTGFVVIGDAVAVIVVVGIQTHKPGDAAGACLDLLDVKCRGRETVMVYLVAGSIVILSQCQCAGNDSHESGEWQIS